MWSNFNKKATQLGIVRGSFCRRIWWSGRSHEDMSSVKKNTHKSHYLNLLVPKCPSMYLTFNLLSPDKFIQQLWCVFPFDPSTPKSDWLQSIQTHWLSRVLNPDLWTQSPVHWPWGHKASPAVVSKWQCSFLIEKEYSALLRSHSFLIKYRSGSHQSLLGLFRQKIW